jgi:hypothetical protein
LTSAHDEQGRFELDMKHGMVNSLSWTSQSTDTVELDLTPYRIELHKITNWEEAIGKVKVSDRTASFANQEIMARLYEALNRLLPAPT